MTLRLENAIAMLKWLDFCSSSHQVLKGGPSNVTSNEKSLSSASIMLPTILVPSWVVLGF